MSETRTRRGIARDLPDPNESTYHVAVARAAAPADFGSKDLQEQLL